jgi:hypothetical protein
LQYAKVKSWSAFENDSFYWKIVVTSEGFQIKPGRKRPDRGWEDDPTKTEFLPLDVTIDKIARRVTQLVQLRASENKRINVTL